ncbi:Ptr2p [Sporobolomyces koalae]|uniref:Ptr2p n=1 Tax=Sporobolomyces koalae TaxID=500713 RepID=UPI003177B7E2
MSLDPNGTGLEAIANTDIHDVGHPDVKDAKDGNNFLVDEKLAVGSSSSNGDSEDDDDYEGKPTAEELATLRRVSGKIDISAYLIAFIELCERFSYYGSTVVFVNYIQRPLPEGSTTGSSGPDQTSGALGKGQQASTGLTTFNQFWVYTTPLLGAWLADTYFGRFRTICYALAIALVGHVILVVSAIPSVLEKPDTAIGVFAAALIVMGFGTGMFKSNVSPLIAEQITDHKLTVTVTKKGERVIIDPAVTTARVYNYFYLMINVGALIGQISMVYAEKRVGFYLAFLLPTAVFALCPIVLFIGRNRYVKTPPTGSVLGKSMQLIGMCFKGKLFKPTEWTKAGFWDAARPSLIPASERPAFLTWNDQWVDEVRRGFKACQVFVFFPIYWLTYNQINNNLTSQAALMNTHGLPNDLLNNLDPLALIILIPILDLFVYPALRRAGFNFSPIKKIFAGFMFGAAAMVLAGITQTLIYRRSVCGKQATTCDAEPFIASLNVWIQTPTYVFIALSEIFASITSLEYAFTKAPKNMRSMVMAVGLFTTAISAAIGEAFLPLSTDPLLEVNYYVMAGLSFAAGAIFWFCFRGLDKEEDSLNQLSAGSNNKDRDEQKKYAA